MKGFGFKAILTTAFLCIAALAYGQQVSWTMTAEKISKHEYNLKITANIPGGYHMYGMEAVKGGPIPTEITPVQTEGITFLGDPVAVTEPKVHMDEAYGTEISVYEGTARFTQKVKVTKKKAEVSVKVRWMVCSGMNCKAPITRTLTVKL